MSGLQLKISVFNDDELRQELKRLMREQVKSITREEIKEWIASEMLNKISSTAMMRSLMESKLSELYDRYGQPEFSKVAAVALREVVREKVAPILDAAGMQDRIKEHIRAIALEFISKLG